MTRAVTILSSLVITAFNVSSARIDDCNCQATHQKFPSSHLSGCLDPTTIVCDMFQELPGVCHVPVTCPGDASPCEFDIHVFADSSACNCNFTWRLVGGAWSNPVISYGSLQPYFVGCGGNQQFIWQTKCDSACAGSCSDASAHILCNIICDCSQCFAGQ